MQEKLYARILLALAAAIGLITVGIAVSAGPADAGRPDVLGLVPCRNDQLVSTRISYDDKGKETLEPGEQAARWAKTTAATQGRTLRDQRVTYSAADVQDIAFVDGQGRINAVLSFERSDSFGWRMESIVECAS